MIYCWKCGKEIPDDSEFCPKCGTKIHTPAAQDKTVTKPETTSEFRETVPVTVEPPKKTEDPPGTPSEILVFVLGIVSIVLSTTGIPGLILSLITRSKVRAREQAVGTLTGKGKVGKTLATIALPVSIAFTSLIALRTILSTVSSCQAVGRLTDTILDWSDRFLK